MFSVGQLDEYRQKGCVVDVIGGSRENDTTLIVLNKSIYQGRDARRTNKSKKTDYSAEMIASFFALTRSARRSRAALVLRR